MFEDIARNIWGHSPEILTTFPRMFVDILRNVGGHFLKCLETFLIVFGNIPVDTGRKLNVHKTFRRHVWWNSPECLATFPRMFEDITEMFHDIPWNVWCHFPECLATFPGIWHFPYSPLPPHPIPRCCMITFHISIPSINF